MAVWKSRGCSGLEIPFLRRWFGFLLLASAEGREGASFDGPLFFSLSILGVEISMTMTMLYEMTYLSL